MAAYATGGINVCFLDEHAHRTASSCKCRRNRQVGDGRPSVNGRRGRYVRRADLYPEDLMATQSRPTGELYDGPEPERATADQWEDMYPADRGEGAQEAEAPEPIQEAKELLGS